MDIGFINRHNRSFPHNIIFHRQAQPIVFHDYAFNFQRYRYSCLVSNFEENFTQVPVIYLRWKIEFFQLWPVSLADRDMHTDPELR